jgi:hypothetical protein
VRTRTTGFPRVLLPLVLALACEQPADFPPNPPATNANAELRADDIAVYDAVVLGYAREGLLLGSCLSPPPDRRAPLSAEDIRRKSADARIFLAPATMASPYHPEEISTSWRMPESRGASALVLRSAVRSMFSRNRQRARLEPYRPQLLSVLRTPRERHRFTLAFSLPGYSLDGGGALVCVFCTVENPLPYMGTTGTYVYLKKRAGQWTMVATAPIWVQ